MAHYLPAIPLAVGGYTLISYYFLKNPLIIHRIKQVRFAKIIAHRGGAAEGLENTLQAYRKAVSLGCDMLELDVQLSKDGRAVVAHDNCLQRLTGHYTFINQTEFRNLPQIQTKVSIDFQPGEYFDCSSLHDFERKFSTLEEVLSEFPEIQINIDIKEKNEALVEEVNRIICENKAQDRCVWGSFDGETTLMCYRKNPDIGLFFSAPRLLSLLLLFYTGLLPFIPLKETHLEIPMLSIFISEKFALESSTVSFGKFPHLLLKICDFLLLRPSLVQHLADRGIPTYLWVLNSDSEYRRALEVGAHGIMTDFPTKLKSFYKDNNMM